LSIGLGVCALWVSAPPAAAQQQLPIIDMHLHARHADYMGIDPPPMCAPFAVMPRWDPAQSGEAGLTFSTMPPCKQPIFPATSDQQVMDDTIAVMVKRNIIGMVSGEPELMATWKAAAPERIIVGLTCVSVEMVLNRTWQRAAPRMCAPCTPKASFRFLVR